MAIQMRARDNRQSPYVLPVLILILLTGLVLRTWNINFDQGMGSHPDERSTACFYAPSIHLPQSWEQFRDPHASPLNPLWDTQEGRRRSFTYGHFPLYLAILTGELLHRLAPVLHAVHMPANWVELAERANQACGGVAVAGRLLMALLDTWTIFLLYLLGRRLYSVRAGLLAAAFYALTAQAIQLSHFFAMDPASTTFTVLAVLGGVRMLQDRSLRAATVTGLGMGLAVASKFSAIPVLAVPFVAVALLFFWPQADEDEGRGRTAAEMLLVGIPLSLLLAGASFFLTSPYAILDWANFSQAVLVEQGAMVRGIADFPFTRQYRNTTPYLYFIQQQVQWGLGLPLGLLSLAGVFLALVRWLLWPFSGLRRWGLGPIREELVIWSWVLPYFGLTGAFLAKFNRYMSPVLPFVLLFAAGLVAWLWQVRSAAPDPLSAEEDTGLMDEPELLPHDPDEFLETGMPRSSGFEEGHGIFVGARNFLPLRISLGWLLALLVVASALFWSVAYVNGVYNREHTWITASRWMYQNIPSGSVILWELWDDPLPKSIPGEPGMDMGSTGLRHIDWSPYEEDTAEKYTLLKQKLQEADYIAYSSKRIYDSVDELPERYPMTIRYYDLIFSGKLGFEQVLDQSSPPTLFGFTFQDRTADESWSLYDHPQVTVFKKVRQLSDAELDQLLGNSWVGAKPYFRGPDSPLSPILNILGLGGSPGSEGSGILGHLIALLSGEDLPNQPSAAQETPDLLLKQPLAELPLVDNYRWATIISQSSLLAVLWWWLVVALLGWVSWPIAFVLFSGLRDRGYLFSRTLGWLLAGWLLWVLASLGWVYNTVVNSWLILALMAALGGIAAIWNWAEMRTFLARRWGLLLVGEGIFSLAYAAFVLIRMANPDIWQPWFGGEKFMEVAFLNGILRSPTFPPLDPHFAGGVINYYYFGIYLVTYLIKLTGIYAEVAFNLAIPTLFALTVVNAFGVAYSAVRRSGRNTIPPYEPSTLSASSTEILDLRPDQGDATVDVGRIVNPPSFGRNTIPPYEASSAEILDIDLANSQPAISVVHQTARATDFSSQLPPIRRLAFTQSTADSWQDGIWAALLAPLFVALLGNLDGLGQVVRRLAEMAGGEFQSNLPLVQSLVRAASGGWQVLSTERSLPGYNFWDPSRVIPFTINEFPYWSFLFADLHPHMIGIPLSVLFLGLALSLLHSHRIRWQKEWGRGIMVLAFFSLLLGALASVNLWELPTYFGLGVLAFLISQYRGHGRINLPLTFVVVVGYLAGTYLLFYPFFSTYTNVGASGVGLVREGDDLGKWLLIWAFFYFVACSWLVLAVRQPARIGDQRPSPAERWLTLLFRRYDRLPRLFYLQRTLMQPGTGIFLTQSFVVGILLATLAALLWGRVVLALCLPPLGLAFLLLWRRGREADPGALFAGLTLVTGFAILAGTQVIYLKDFLGGGDWYRMNTLFKFFIQVWVLMGLGTAVAVSRLFGSNERSASAPIPRAATNWSPRRLLRPAWSAIFGLLLLTSLAYLAWGTPARLDQRFVGWRPAFGTLNGMDYLRQGAYTWPDGNHVIETRYDWEAIQWLLDNVRGNLVIVESAETDYYRAGGTRAATLTGLSGPLGMHKGEQRSGAQVGERDGLLREFWNTPDLAHTREIMAKLDVGLIYVGQLERQQHGAGADKLDQMAAAGQLTTLYVNDRVTIYGVPGKVVRGDDGLFYPV